jgi:hypothetical protein
MLTAEDENCLTIAAWTVACAMARTMAGYDHWIVSMFALGCYWMAFLSIDGNRWVPSVPSGLIFALVCDIVRTGVFSSSADPFAIARATAAMGLTSLTMNLLVRLACMKWPLVFNHGAIVNNTMTM